MFNNLKSRKSDGNGNESKICFVKFDFVFNHVQIVAEVEIDSQKYIGLLQFGDDKEDLFVISNKSVEMYKFKSSNRTLDYWGELKYPENHQHVEISHFSNFVHNGAHYMLISDTLNNCFYILDENLKIQTLNSPSIRQFKNNILSLPDNLFFVHSMSDSSYLVHLDPDTRQLEIKHIMESLGAILALENSDPIGLEANDQFYMLAGAGKNSKICKAQITIDTEDILTVKLKNVHKSWICSETDQDYLICSCRNEKSL